MYKATIDEVKIIINQGQYDIVPIYKEIPVDNLTPIDVLKKFKAKNEDCYLFESVDQQKRWSRYSFLGFKPLLHIACYDNMMKVDGQTFEIEHPHDYIRELLSHYKSPRIQTLPTLTGGLVGYFGYEYFHYNEPTLKTNEENKKHIPDVYLMLFDTMICFDHLEKKIKLITNIKTNNIEEEYTLGFKRLDDLEIIIQADQESDIENLHILEDFNTRLSKERYCDMVEIAKRHIYEGDIFQIVLANQFKAKATGSLRKTYEVLRNINPSPYMFYISTSVVEVVGASPETLVKLEDHRLYTYPLAGTRPRGKDDKEDELLIKDLLSDEKELSEHNMLVDLGRNDIGKISEFNSVKVENYMDVLKFSHVMHIGSTVSGKIRKDCDALDAVDSLLPAGTLSGAPKIKASELIYSLEQHKRYLYGGAIGYIDFTGQLDTCIAIRFAYKAHDIVHVGSGAGIVADSVPEKEFQECCNKAAAILKALAEGQ